MAQIKITLTIEASAFSLAHSAIDAMDAKLRQHGGHVVSARLMPLAAAPVDADGNTHFSLAKEKLDWTREDEHLSDPELNERLARALPAYNGWTAAWEHPGYLAFHREGSPSVFATPDYHERGEISVEVTVDATGHSTPRPNIPWDRAGRTPEGFIEVMRPVLDSVTPCPTDSDDIFETVMRAMQPAEERCGPEGAQYIALMERIAHEAQRRANTARELLEPREWEIKFNREHTGCTQYILAHSRAEADMLWRARMVKDGEIDVDDIDAKIEVRS